MDSIENLIISRYSHRMVTWWGTYPNKEISLRKNNRSIMGLYSILEDKDGNIWLGTKEIGLFQLKRQEQIITLFTILNTRQMILIV